ncbi:MAG: hypothetical protein PVJ72_10845 [Gammaproteobacteria bacterium]|jgi:hypothetical protein
MLRYIVVLFFVYLLSACATTTTFDSIPTTDEDFRLPPHEFVEKFEDIGKFQVEKRSSSAFGEYQQLAEAWGTPGEVTVNRESKHVQLGWFSAFTGALMIQTPAIWLGTASIYALLAPPPSEVHTWTKGDYRVAALTSKQPITGKKRVVNYWDWQVKNEEDYVPLFEKNKRQFHVLFQFRVARGFEDIDKTDIDNPSGGSGLQLDLGFEYSDLFKKTDLQLIYGYKTYTLVDNDDKNLKIKVTGYPIQVAAMYNLNKRWRLGGGLLYLTNTKLDYNFIEDESLDDALGATLQLDFGRVHHQRFGIAIEAIKQDMADGSSFNSSNFNAFMQTAF